MERLVTVMAHDQHIRREVIATVRQRGDVMYVQGLNLLRDAAALALWSTLEDEQRPVVAGRSPTTTLTIRVGTTALWTA